MLRKKGQWKLRFIIIHRGGQNTREFKGIGGRNKDHSVKARGG